MNDRIFYIATEASRLSIEFFSHADEFKGARSATAVDYQEDRVSSYSCCEIGVPAEGGETLFWIIEDLNGYLNEFISFDADEHEANLAECDRHEARGSSKLEHGSISMLDLLPSRSATI